MQRPFYAPPPPTGGGAATTHARARSPGSLLAAPSVPPAPTSAPTSLQAPAERPNTAATAELAREIKALRTAIVSTAAGDVLTSGRARSPAAAAGSAPLPPSAVDEISSLRHELRHTSEAYAALSKQSRAQKQAADQKEREMAVEIQRLKGQLTEFNRLRKEHGESTSTAKGYKERAEAAETTAETLRERLEEVRKGKDNAASTIARQAEEIHSLRQDLYKARDVCEAGDRAVSQFASLSSRCQELEGKLATAIQEREALLNCVQEQQRTIESVRGHASSSLSMAQQLSSREGELEALRRENTTLKHRYAELEIQNSDLKHSAEPLALRAKQADELESVQQELLRTISAQAAQLQEAQDALIVAQGKDGTYQNAALLDRKRLERAERLLGQYRALEEELVRRTGDPFFDALLLQRRIDAISGGSSSTTASGSDNLPLLPAGILGTLGKRRRGKGSVRGSDDSSSDDSASDDDNNDHADKPLLARYLSRLDSRVKKESTKQAAAEIAAVKEQCASQVKALQVQCDELGRQLTTVTADRDEAQKSLHALRAVDSRIGSLLQDVLPGSQSAASAAAAASKRERSRSRSRSGAAGSKKRSASVAAAANELQKEQLAKQLLSLDWLACLDNGDRTADDDGEEEDQDEEEEGGSSSTGVAQVLPRIHSLLAALKDSLSLAVRQKRVAECEAQDLREELVSLREGSSMDAVSRKILMGEASAAVKSAKAEREKVSEELQEAEQKFLSASQALADERTRVQRYKERVLRAKAIIEECEKAALVANNKASAAEATSHSLKLELAASEQRWKDAKAMNERALELLHHRDEEVRRLEAQLLLATTQPPSHRYRSPEDEDDGSFSLSGPIDDSNAAHRPTAAGGYRAISVPRYGQAAATNSNAHAAAPAAATASTKAVPAVRATSAGRAAGTAGKPRSAVATAAGAGPLRGRSRSPQNSSGSISLQSSTVKGKIATANAARATIPTSAAAVTKPLASAAAVAKALPAKRLPDDDEDEEGESSEDEDFSVSLTRSVVKPAKQTAKVAVAAGMKKAAARVPPPAVPAPASAAVIVGGPLDSSAATTFLPSQDASVSISLGSIGQHTGGGSSSSFPLNAEPAVSAAKLKSGNSPDTVASKKSATVAERSQWNELLLSSSAPAPEPAVAVNAPAPAPAPAAEGTSADSSAAEAPSTAANPSDAKKLKKAMRKEKKAAKKAATAALISAVSALPPPPAPAPAPSAPAPAPASSTAKPPVAPSSSTATASGSGKAVAAKGSSKAQQPAATSNSSSDNQSQSQQLQQHQYQYYSDDFDSYPGTTEEEGDDERSSSSSHAAASRRKQQKGKEAAKQSVTTSKPAAAATAAAPASSSSASANAAAAKGAGSRRGSLASLREKLQKHDEELGVGGGAASKALSAAALASPPALLPYHSHETKQQERDDDDDAGERERERERGQEQETSFAVSTPGHAATATRIGGGGGLGLTMATTRGAMGQTFALSPPSGGGGGGKTEKQYRDLLAAETSSRQSYALLLSKTLSPSAPAVTSAAEATSPIWQSPSPPKRDAADLLPAGIPNPRLTTHGEALLLQQRGASGPHGQPEALFQREAVVAATGTATAGAGKKPQPQQISPLVPSSVKLKTGSATVDVGSGAGGGIKRGSGISATSAAASAMLSSKLKTSPL